MADALDSILNKAQKKYNLSVGPLSQIAQDATFITSGNIAIDYIIGGGLPLGRSVELAGPPSSGKSTTALQTAANLQKAIIQGGDPSKGIKSDDKILYLDYEQTIDQNYSKALGLDIDHESFLLTQPDTLEDGANLALELIETGRVRLVIWDSVAAMMPSSKAQAEIGKSLPAVQAKLMSDLGQRLNPILHEHGTLNIFVNHLKEMMDMSGRRPAHLGPKLGTPGGTALKFYSSVRVEFKQLRQNKETTLDHLSGEIVETPGSIDVEIKVSKNKVAPPFRKAIARVRFGRGFDNFWTAMQILVSQKEVMYSSGYYYFHKVEKHGLAPDWMERAKTGQQRAHIRKEERLFEAADLHPEWREAVIEHAKSVVSEASLQEKRTPSEIEYEEEASDTADETLGEVEKKSGLL